MPPSDLPNPFVKSIVADAWETPEADAPQLHSEGFEICRAALDRVTAGGRSRSVLLRGQPGSGKTHLLARLRQAVAAPPADAAADPPQFDPPQAAFSFVRLQTGARSIARHVRRTLVEDLLREAGRAPTPLEWMFLLHAKEHLHKPEKFRVWWLSLRWPERRQQAEEQVEELLDRFDRSLHLGRNVCAALRHIVLDRRRREACDWLRDGELPDMEREELGMTPANADGDPEEEAVAVIRAIARLAAPHLPIVLCFDQIEALQTHPADLAGLFAFGRLVSSLHDQTSNLLLISCIQSTFNDTLRRSVREADMDRLAEEAGLLRRPTWDEAEDLLARRLNANPELAAIRRGHDSKLWPLPADTLRELVEERNYTPRRLIAWCKAEFERFQSGEPSPSLTPSKFLTQQFAEALREAESIEDHRRSDETITHGLPLAWSAGGWGEASADADFGDVDLVLESESGPVPISLCNFTGNRLTGRLKRLRDQVESGELDNLVLVRHADLPFSETAPRA
ncbi:MAG: ATP-binding protein, partial [Planctomycetes bacterium]|nr:ATP-binding protein [Planctomycetota bacterium]